MIFKTPILLCSRIKFPKAIKEQLWIKYYGENFKSKCLIKWCNNNINVFNFTIGHNTPISKGGKNKIENLKPICSRCNSCMGNKYTIDEWNNNW